MTWWVSLLVMGILLAVIAGAVGPLVLWRRYAFFGDTVAHSAILSASLAYLFDQPNDLIMVAVVVLFALILGQHRMASRTSIETKLSVLSQGAMALGIVVFSLIQLPQHYFTTLMIGDLLAIGVMDLLVTAGVAAVVFLLTWRGWTRMLLVIISPELALTEGINVQRVQFLMTVIIGVTIGILAQIVGVLLIVAVVVIPAAAARYLTRSPLMMMLVTGAITAVAYLSGVLLSYHYDIPTSATIVLVGFGIYLGSQQVTRYSGRQRSEI